MADDEAPRQTKLTSTKRQWASEGRFLTGQTSRPETERLPPGQHLVRNWPVLDLGRQPAIDLAEWRLEVTGAVDKPMVLDWQDFLDLPQVSLTSDIHCVTTWSRYDNDWQGVRTRDLLDLAGVSARADAVMLTCYDDYTTNLTLDDFTAPDAILARSWEGKPVSREHGGPLRLVLPHLYFWKSAKWLRRIDVRTGDTPGFWEENGYHLRGDPWREQRYSDD